MPYCPNCGKELKDGEVCSCQSSPEMYLNGQPAPSAGSQDSQHKEPKHDSAQNPQNAAQNYYEAPAYNANAEAKDAKTSAFSDLMFRVAELLGKVIKHPSEAVPEAALKGDWGVSGCIFLVYLILAFSFNMVAMALSGFSYDVGQYFLQIPVEMISILAQIILIVLILLLVTGGKNGERAKIRHGVALAAVVLLPAVMSVIFGKYLSLIPMNIFRILSAGFKQFFDVSSALFLYFGLRSFYPKDDRMPFIIGTIYAALTIVMSTIEMLV